MELHEALSSISEIRGRLAAAQAAQTFRGYRAAPVGFSGLLAASAALAQWHSISDPVAELPRYLTLWLGVAILSVAATALDMWLRRRENAATLDSGQLAAALQEFAPSLIAGAVVTAVLVGLGQGLWMLPGLWQLFYSLGIFASRKLLPPAVVWPAAFYLATGTTMLLAARAEYALAPWAMGLPFTVGQFLLAVVLYFQLEREGSHAEELQERI